METITINYRMEDYLQANRIVYQTNLAQQILKMVYITLCVLFSFILIINYLLWKNIDTFSIFFIIFSLFFIFYEWTILPSSVKKMFKEQKRYFEEVTLIFSESEIIQICSISETKLKWIYKYVWTEKMLLIFTSPLTFVIVPKKYCADEEQYKRICEIVTNFYQGEKKLKPI
jgi:hypothetical protein